MGKSKKVLAIMTVSYLLRFFDGNELSFLER